MTEVTPDYSPAGKVAKTADLGGSRPLHLGVLLESSEYDIELPYMTYRTVTGVFLGCVASIQQNHLKIITHKIDSILHQELMLHGPNAQQKISFFVVSNLFDLSCKS